MHLRCVGVEKTDIKQVWYWTPRRSVYSRRRAANARVRSPCGASALRMIHQPIVCRLLNGVTTPNRSLKWLFPYENTSNNNWNLLTFLIRFAYKPRHYRLHVQSRAQTLLAAAATRRRRLTVSKMLLLKMFFVLCNSWSIILSWAAKHEIAAGRAPMSRTKHWP